MITYQITPGTTDVSVVIRIIDSTDGTPETGVVFNTAGIDLWYRRELAASVDITEATLAALTTAHADGGFLHINDGYYRLDLPDAACATGVAGVMIGGTVTGMVVIGCYIQLEALVNDIYSDTTIIASDLLVLSNEVSDIYSDTTLLVTNVAAVDSQVTATDSQLTVTDAVADTIASDLLVISGIISDIYSDTVIISSDTAVIEAGGGALTATQASQLARIQSDTIIAQSDIIIIGSDLLQVYSDTTIAASDLVLLTAPRDGTAGAYPELGIIDQGTAQSATATTLVLRAATPFSSDDACNGAILLAHGSDQGYWQARTIDDYTTADDTATVSTWDVTPSGTITYKVFGTPPSTASSLTATQASQLTRIQSDLIIAQSDIIIIGSDLLQVYSDTTHVHSDTTAIHTQTTTAATSLTNIDSQVTATDSQLTATDTVVDTIASDLLIVSGIISDIYSDTVIITSDTTAMHTQTTAIVSDTTAIHSDTTAVHSDTTAVHSDTTAIQAKTDSLTFTVANAVDANVQRINDVTITGDGQVGTEFGV